MRTTIQSRRAAVILAALALGAAGCGGGEEESPEATPAGEPASRGQQLFTTTCGGCHTLEAAGTNGSVGPNLDNVGPDRDQVLEAIAEGPESMPENLLRGADAEAVADYVAENAG